MVGGVLASRVAIVAKPFRPSIHIIAVELSEEGNDVAESKVVGYMVPMLHPNIMADGLRAQLGHLNYLVNFLVIFFSH